LRTSVGRGAVPSAVGREGAEEAEASTDGVTRSVVGLV
jgi:hypothetical protein